MMIIMVMLIRYYKMYISNMYVYARFMYTLRMLSEG